MKVNIYKAKNNRFYTSIGIVENEFQFNLTPEELETLHDKISKELEKTKKENNEMVWNPRSQRHETLMK